MIMGTTRGISPSRRLRRRRNGSHRSPPCRESRVRSTTWRMTYAAGRIVHDADSHVVETPEWLEPWADDATRARMKPIYVGRVRPGEESEIDAARARRLDSADRERAEHELMLRKNWNALGSFVGED